MASADITRSIYRKLTTSAADAAQLGCNVGTTSVQRDDAASFQMKFVTMRKRFHRDIQPLFQDYGSAAQLPETGLGR
jgi:hypothetical protein